MGGAEGAPHTILKKEMSADQALILIVDDDFDFLEINRFILEGAGYRVVTATNPAEAQTRISAEAPDLVITDLMLSSIDADFDKPIDAQALLAKVGDLLAARG